MTSEHQIVCNRKIADGELQTALRRVSLDQYYCDAVDDAI